MATATTIAEISTNERRAALCHRRQPDVAGDPA